MLQGNKIEHIKLKSVLIIGRVPRDKMMIVTGLYMSTPKNLAKNYQALNFMVN